MNKTVMRILLFLLAFMIVFSCVYSVFAAGIEEEDITAAAVILVDAETGTVLYEKNADEQRAPASTTKLLTAVLALENLQMDQEVTVPPEAQTSGSNMGLKPGQIVSVETLLYGLMLSSGNDAAVTLAIAVSGTVEAFAQKMNEKAQALGMNHSHFVTASGLDAEGHYVTVRDMSILARYVYNQEALRTIMATEEKTLYTVDKSVSYQLENTNLLIHTPRLDGSGEPYTGPSYLYEYATGMKTGSTRNSDGCLVASAEKDGQKLIALVFGDNSDGEKDRWKIAAQLFDYGFSSYKNFSLTELIGGTVGLDVVGGPIINGEAAKLQCIALSQEGAEGITLPVDTDPNAIEYTVVPDSAALNAPISEGTAVGSIEITLNGEILLKGQLVAAEAMMTAEDYAKLSGTQSEISNLLNLDTEKRQNLRKYTWLWLLIPLGGVVFLIWRGLQNNRHSRRRYRGAAMRNSHMAQPKRSIDARAYRQYTRPVGRAAVQSNTRQAVIRRAPANRAGSNANSPRRGAVRRTSAMQSGRPNVRRTRRRGREV